MLTVGLVYGNAYAIAIKKEIISQTGRNVTISAVHTVLFRLGKKGFLESKQGEAQAKRGDKRKRHFSVTNLGKIGVKEGMELRQKLWQQVPILAFKLS